MAKHNRCSFLTRLLIYRYRLRTAKLGCCLEPNTKIGSGVCFPHGFPFVINSQAVVGRNCRIYPNVLVGSSRTKEGFPVIGDNCVLGHGCLIIGNCKIGDWCFISPGAFVSKDVPEGSVVGYGLNNILSSKGKEVVAKYLV